MRTLDDRPVLPLRLLAGLLALAPLVVLPAQLDFALLPQQAFIQAGVLLIVIAWWRRSRRAGGDEATRGGLRTFDLPLLAFLGWSLLALVAAPDRLAGLPTLAHWTACGVVYWVVSRTPGARPRTTLARAVIAGAAAVALIGLGAWAVSRRRAAA